MPDLLVKTKGLEIQVVGLADSPLQYLVRHAAKDYRRKP